MRPRAATKDTTDLFRDLMKQGCDIERAGSGHWKVTRAGYPRAVFLSGTRIGSRSVLNNRARLRKILEVDI